MVIKLWQLRLKRHAAFGAIARVILLNFRMHRADVGGVLWHWGSGKWLELG
jgi:hypothetical protein